MLTAFSTASSTRHHDAYTHCHDKLRADAESARYNLRVVQIGPQRATSGIGIRSGRGALTSGCTVPSEHAEPAEWARHANTR